MVLADCSDGSIIFRFGYASEIAGGVELEKAEGLTEVEKDSPLEGGELLEKSKLLLGREDGVADEGYASGIVGRLELEEAGSLIDVEKGNECEESEVVEESKLLGRVVAEAVNNSSIKLEEDIVLCRESDNNALEDCNDSRTGLKDDTDLWKEYDDVPENDINVGDAPNVSEIGHEGEVALCREHVADPENETVMLAGINDSSIGLGKRLLEESGPDILSSDSFANVVGVGTETTVHSEKSAVEEDKGQFLKPDGVTEFDYRFNIQNSIPKEDFEVRVDKEVSALAVDLESNVGCHSKSVYASEEKNESEPMISLASSEPQSVVEVVGSYGSSESLEDNLKIKDLDLAVDGEAELSYVSNLHYVTTSLPF